MSIEEEIFKKDNIDFNKLKEYGFKLVNNNYVFESNINFDFKAIISIDLKGNISGKVIDIETNLEYSNIRLNNPGSYALKIKNEYELLLLDILNNCGTINPFIFEQSNRIAKYIKDKYQVNPEFLWDKTPDCGVFRNKDTNKWFGIIMQIDRSKLMNQKGLVEVINVKINDLVDDYVDNKSIFKAYHMNKKSWITIILDESLKDCDIIKLIDKSHDLVNG